MNYWTEDQTGRMRTKNISVVYHYSDRPIKQFRRILTCFFVVPLPRKEEEHCYKVTIPARTLLDIYGDREVRGIPQGNWSIEKIDQPDESNPPKGKEWGPGEEGYCPLWDYKGIETDYPF